MFSPNAVIRRILERDPFDLCTKSTTCSSAHRLVAPEAKRLIDFGLIEGSSNQHPGQGTANRRFFFENAMLELLWVENPAETRSDGVRRLGLWERWSRRAIDSCPFVICYRPVSDKSIPPPFE